METSFAPSLFGSITISIAFVTFFVCYHRCHFSFMILFAYNCFGPNKRHFLPPAEVPCHNFTNPLSAIYFSKNELAETAVLITTRALRALLKHSLCVFRLGSPPHIHTWSPHSPLLKDPGVLCVDLRRPGRLCHHQRSHPTLGKEVFSGESILPPTHHPPLARAIINVYIISGWISEYRRFL